MAEMGTKHKESSAVVSPEPKRARLGLEREGVEGGKYEREAEVTMCELDDRGGAPELRDEEGSPENKDESHTGTAETRDEKETKGTEKYIYVEKDEGDTFMGFGKYEVMTFRQVYTSYPGYYKWAKRVTSPSPQLKRFIDWVDATEANARGKTILTVGKHAGHSYSYIANHCPGYVDWIRSLETPCPELKEFIEWTKTQKKLFVKLPAKITE